MDIQNNINNKTAIHNEQQLKTKQNIINDIIKILADNNLTIADSKDILYETTKMIYKQVISTFNYNNSTNSLDYKEQLAKLSQDDNFNIIIQKLIT